MPVPLGAASSIITVLWLTPAEPAQEFFRATVQRLALENNAPVFAPHLTLGVGPQENLRKVGGPPIELRVQEIAFSEKFTKSLFVRFILTPQLAELRNSLGVKQSGYDPHLSLLYADLPLLAKEQLAAGIVLPFRTVRFDRVEAVRCRAETNSRSDVESWEIITSQPLD